MSGSCRRCSKILMCATLNYCILLLASMVLLSNSSNNSSFTDCQTHPSTSTKKNHFFLFFFHHELKSEISAEKKNGFLDLGGQALKSFAKIVITGSVVKLKKPKHRVSQKTPVFKNIPNIYSVVTGKANYNY